MKLLDMNGRNVCSLAFFLFFLMITDAHALAANALDKRISIEVKNTNIKRVLKLIEKLADVKFAYSPENLGNTDVSVSAQGQTVGTVLREVFSNQAITFEAVNENLVVLHKSREMVEALTVNGTVTDNDGKPLHGVVVKVRGTEQTATTNSSGEFTIVEPSIKSTLVFSMEGFRKQEMSVADRDFLYVSLVMRR